MLRSRLYSPLWSSYGSFIPVDRGRITALLPFIFMFTIPHLIAIPLYVLYLHIPLTRSALSRCQSSEISADIIDVIDLGTVGQTSEADPRCISCSYCSLAYLVNSDGDVDILYTGQEKIAGAVKKESHRLSLQQQSWKAWLFGVISTAKKAI